MSYIFSEFPYIFAYFLREGAGEDVMLPLSIRICSCFSMFFANPEDSGQLCRERSIFRTTLYLLLVQDEDDLLLA